MSGGWTKVGLFRRGHCLLWRLGSSFYAGPDRARAGPTPPAVPGGSCYRDQGSSQHDVPIILTGLGTVTALNTATISQPDHGAASSASTSVRGQSVKKGDLLAQIDPRTLPSAASIRHRPRLEHDQAPSQGTPSSTSSVTPIFAKYRRDPRNSSLTTSRPPSRSSMAQIQKRPGCSGKTPRRS